METEGMSLEELKQLKRTQYEEACSRDSPRLAGSLAVK